MPPLQQYAAVQRDTFGFCQVASVKTNAAFCSLAALPTPVPSWFLCSVESLFCSHSVCYEWLGVGVSRSSLVFIPTEDGSQQSVAASLPSPSLGMVGFSVSWKSWINVRKPLGLDCFSLANLNRCDG